MMYIYERVVGSGWRRRLESRCYSHISRVRVRLERVMMTSEKTTAKVSWPTRRVRQASRRVLEVLAEAESPRSCHVIRRPRHQDATSLGREERCGV